MDRVPPAVQLRLKFLWESALDAADARPPQPLVSQRFAATLRDLAAAWTAAAKASTEAAAATADLLPRMGRVRTHGEHSMGTPDPGAHSLALIASAVGAMLADPTPEEN